MMHVLVLLAMAVASTAAAQAPQTVQATADTPRRAIPCAMNEMTLHADGSDPVLCWDKGCMKLDMEDGAAPHVRPGGTTWLDMAAVVRDHQVCLGTTCRTFGPKLAAALAAARTKHDPQDGPPPLSATADLNAIVIDRVAWSLPADRALTFTVPALYRKSREQPVTAGIVPAGSLLVVWWSTCAGPCTKFSIVDSSGRAKGPEGQGGGGVFQLDRGRFVVYGEYGSMYVYDLGTARPRGSVLELTQDPGGVSMIRADDTTVLAMYSRGRGIEVAKIGAYADATSTPRLGATQYLPKCGGE